ncbi:hypothetical protein MRB53_038115 [Persea americana]|nr:hypothetical protein MRB53_038115 [Persea americana]
MKYLPLQTIENVTSALNFDTSDCHVVGGCDLYTTKAAGGDRKLYKNIENSLESQHESLMRLSASLSPPNSELFSLNLSRSSPFGPLSQGSSRRTFAYLIATLNASHPDYDFSHILRPSDFIKESRLSSVMNVINETLYNLRPRPAGALFALQTGLAGSAGPQTPGGSQVWSPKMWQSIDHEMGLKECEMYRYAPEDDPFDGEGSAIWSYHYFFFNKERKRVCYLFIRGVSLHSHSPTRTYAPKAVARPKDLVRSRQRRASSHLVPRSAPSTGSATARVDSAPMMALYLSLVMTRSMQTQSAGAAPPQSIVPIARWRMTSLKLTSTRRACPGQPTTTTSSALADGVGGSSWLGDIYPVLIRRQGSVLSIVDDSHHRSHVQIFGTLPQIAESRAHEKQFDIGRRSIVLSCPAHNNTHPPCLSRYQVKYKRRRAGKTDYYARKRLITQAKNKYNAPKYRLVVRFTNRDIICQIVSSELNGDKVFCAAYAHELKAYGIEHGLTNWAAAYATGLLIARRALKKLGLDEDFAVSRRLMASSSSPRPPRARTAKAADHSRRVRRGILIPHSEKRFPGYDIESKELDADTLRKYIFGGHVAEYMETLADDDEERYKSQFQGYIDDDVEAEGLEELYGEAHKAIREDPFKKVEADGETKTKEEWKAESLKYRQKKLTKAEKEERVKAKIAELKAAA